MLSKADFQRAITETIDRYPDLAARYRAQDPIILQHLESIATMLAMLSQSQDVAQSEVFLKARDATVLADAAMRGITPKARPARVELLARNAGSAPAQITAGRLLQDARGNPWVVVSGAELAPNAEAPIQAEQRTRVERAYAVTRDEPFHAVQIAKTLADGQHLASLTLLDASGEWAFADRYVNIGAGERVYHVESDERQRVYLRFGMRDVVGVQPALGATFTLRIDYTHGPVAPEFDSVFSLASVQAPADAFLRLRMQSMLAPGQPPIGVDALRTLARYPSVYDHNAVYLGEFDFLVRRRIPDLRFLSVWNERIEEKARGPDADHINRLFLAVLSADGTEPTELLADAAAGSVIAEADWSATQQAIREAISRADDSYRVRFVAPLRAPQAWTVEAMIGSAYQPTAIEQRIREVVLARYGEAAMRRGGANFSIQDIYAALRNAIPEIAEPGADIAVTIPDQSIEYPPETWRYVAPETLSVTVRAVGVAPPAWGW